MQRSNKMKRYTIEFGAIEFGGSEIEINAESERDAMEKFRVWIANAPGAVWIAEYNCIKVEEID